jgi:hypothetical protein
MAPDFNLLELTVRLAEEFEQRGMKGHVKRLREFYARVRAQERADAHRSPRPWSEDLVFEWLQVFRVEPFQHAYPMKPSESDCWNCGYSGKDTAAYARTRLVFPGGALIECQRCWARWLTK